MNSRRNNPAVVFVVILIGLAVAGSIALAASTHERESTFPGLALGTADAGTGVVPGSTAPVPPSPVVTTVPASTDESAPATHASASGAPTPSPSPSLTPPATTSPHLEPPAPPVFYVSGDAVALTIDDGPNPVYTPEMLDLLAANHVRATFCVIGEWAARYPDLVRRIVAEGHALCDHSWDHDEGLSTRSPDVIAADIDRSYDAIVAAAGVAPVYFRAPGGTWSDPLLAAVAEKGMTPLGWSVDPRDWSRPGTDAITAAVLDAGPGDIILCHDGGGDRQQTIDALDRALPVLLGRGLDFVTP